MRYNRSLFTVYSFITRHLFQFCVLKLRKECNLLELSVG